MAVWLRTLVASSIHLAHQQSVVALGEPSEHKRAGAGGVGGGSVEGAQEGRADLTNDLD